MPEQEENPKPNSGSVINSLPCGKCHTVTYSIVGPTVEIPEPKGGLSNPDFQAAYQKTLDAFQNFVDDVLNEAVTWASNVQCQKPCKKKVTLTLPNPQIELDVIYQQPLNKVAVIGPTTFSFYGTGELKMKVCCVDSK